MKKLNTVIIFLSIVVLTSCSKKEDLSHLQPNILRVKEICELATHHCYFRNVGKYTHNRIVGDDKTLWVEYRSVVSLGIDASRVTIDVTDNKVTISIPEAQVLDINVEEPTEDNYYYNTVIKHGSAKGAGGGAVAGAASGALIGSKLGGVGALAGAGVGALVGGIGGLFAGKKVETNVNLISPEDQVEVYQIARKNVEKMVDQDSLLLSHATERAKELLENYVHNIGSVLHQQYEVEFIIQS